MSRTARPTSPAAATGNAPSRNAPEFTVTQLSGAIKRTLEDAYGYVRVRGELGRVTRAGSGHVYLDLKDERAVLSSVVWKGAAARLKVRPEQGMEVIASGRLTTFAGQSRYQLVIDTLEPAGVGALMALYEERKKKLAAEGLFASERKRPIPRLPRVIGVVTSPTGAVIRDVLHRLRDRYPVHVLVWPALVQGDRAPEQIVAGIEGLNALPERFPRPDTIIVARGGGSLEDLWCFNDEAVARAAAASAVPLISAVGHETDTTLIDFAADLRAPTPTAAAEMAVPVRLEMLSDLTARAARLQAAGARAVERRELALAAAARGLGRPEALIEPVEQRLDRAGERLSVALTRALERAEARFGRAEAALRPGRLRQTLSLRAQRLTDAGARLRLAPLAAVERSRARLAPLRLRPVAAREVRRRQQALGAARISRALPDRLVRDARRALDRAARDLAQSTATLDRRASALDAQARLLTSYSFQGVLERGFALVTAPDGQVVRSARAEAGPVALRFADGVRAAVIEDDGEGEVTPKPETRPKRPRRRKAQPAEADAPVRDQQTLFE